MTNDISRDNISLDVITLNDIRGEMETQITKYLPLTESTAYILLSLVEPSHGYAIMQNVEAMSQGTVKIGPGTLYGAFTTLESEGLIRKVGEADRRKTYALTDKGKGVLKEHIRRSEILAKNGKITKDW